MADYLQFDGVDDFLAFDADISFNIGVDAYSFQFTANIKSFPSTLTAGIVGTGTSSTGGIVMRAASSANSLSVVSSNALRYESGPNFLILNETHTYRLEHDSAATGGQYRWYRDDILFSAGNYTVNINLILKVFGKTRADGLWSDMDVYSFEFISGFSTNPSYPDDVFTGSGNRLTDSGGINGATINGAQWVEYDDGTGSTTNYDAGSASGISISSNSLLQMNASLRSVGDVVIASSASLHLSCSASALSEFSIDILTSESAAYSVSSESLIGLDSQGVLSRNSNASSISQLAIQMSGGSLGPSNYDATAISGFTIDSECGTQRSSDISSVSNFGLSVSSSVSVRFSSGSLINLEISFIGEQSRKTDVSAISNISVVATGSDSSDPIEIGFVRFNAGIITGALRQSPYNIPASISYEPGKTQRVIRWS